MKGIHFSERIAYDSFKVNCGDILSKLIAEQFTYGILAQLGEHLPYKQRVIGSSPIGPTQWLIINRSLEDLPIWLNWQSS